MAEQNRLEHLDIHISYTVEMDEFWSFVGSKKHRRWTWYEIYIIAFFIGLYFNQRRPMTADPNKKRGFGHPIQYWGNQENRRNRKSYSKIREYIFVSLIAKSDIDFINIDKGKITRSKAVDILVEAMEEYANYGFFYMEDKLTDNPDYFFRNSAFLDLFLNFISPADKEDEELESLD